jgi:hypothetical protein
MCIGAGNATAVNNLVALVPGRPQKGAGDVTAIGALESD